MRQQNYVRNPRGYTFIYPRQEGATNIHTLTGILLYTRNLYGTDVVCLFVFIGKTNKQTSENIKEN